MDQKKLLKRSKSGDTDFLSAAGRKGAEAAAATKKAARDKNDEITIMMQEIDAEKAQLDEAFRKRQANEHIISPDGEVLDYQDHDEDNL